MRARTGRSRGFSLVELLVTIAIAAILIGLALPSLGSLTADSRASAVTGEFANALQAARSEAIKRSRPVVLCSSGNPSAAAPSCGGDAYASGWIVYVDATGGFGRDALDPLMLQHEPSAKGIDYGPSTGVAARVRFDASGAHVLDTGMPFRGTFAIGVAGESRTVEIAASGRISVIRP